MSDRDLTITSEEPSSAPPPTPPTYTPPPLWGSCRLSYTICAFLAAMNLMITKFNVGFAFVCMIDSKKQTSNISSTADYMDWDKETQGHILSAFFYGYLVTLLFGGWLSQVVSAKGSFVVGNAVAGVLFFLLPATAYGGPWYFFAIRFLQGMFSGLMLPAIQLIFSSWTHAEERTKLVSFSFIGYNVGMIVTYPISSLFCHYIPEMGWAYSFHFTGILMTACAIAYYFLVFDSVHQHPRISAEEKAYILSGISLHDEKKAIPYKKIFTSIPVYAYFVAHYCQVFGYAAIALTLPFFLKTALKLSLVENGFVSAVPSILSTTFRFLIGLSFTRIHSLTKWSLTRFRKVNHMIGTLVPAAIFLIVTIMSDSDLKIPIIVLLSLAESISDVGYCGSYAPSLIDIAPNFTGFLSATATAVANVPFISVAQIFGHLSAKGTLAEYKVLWYVVSATYIVGCIVYVSFGTSVRQRWG